MRKTAVFARKYGIILVFVLLCLLVSAVCQFKVIRGEWPENVFTTTDNFLLILYQVSINGILAIGMTIVIISGGIDLSVGSVLAFAGMLAASFATGSAAVTPWSGTYGIAIPVVSALLAGAACGALNGWVVSRFRIQAFIAMLGMLLAARGFTMSLTGGNPISSLSTGLRWFGTGRLLRVPIPVVILLIVFGCAWVLLNKTVFGRHVYAVGGNENSARTSGIKTNRVKIWVYVSSGFLAGVAGIILTAKTGSAQTNAGNSYELDAIAAAVIGGSSMSGGVGTVSGTLFGALIMGAASKKVRLAVLMYGDKAEFVQLMQRYGRQHPAVTGGLVDIIFYDGRYDAAVQNDQAQLAINSKCDAVIVNPMDFEANTEVVKKAKAAHISVIVTNARLNTLEMTSEVASDDVLGGYLEAQNVLQRLACKGNIVIIEGPKGGSGEIQRGQGNMTAISECPAGPVRILERRTANWSRAEAFDLMQNWLSKHRGGINGVIAQNDEMALGAIEAIKSARLNVNNFAIAGIDGVTDALNAVKRGEMTSILQDAKAQMQASIDVALRAVLGTGYKPMSPIWKQYQNSLQWNDGQNKRYAIP